MIQSDFNSMIIASDYQDKKHGLQAGTFLLSLQKASRQSASVFISEMYLGGILVTPVRSKTKVCCTDV